MTRPKRNRFTAMLRRQGRILGWLTAFAILSFAGNPAIAEGDCDAAKSAKDAAEDRQGRAEVDLTIAQATGDQQAIQDAEEALRDADSAVTKAEQDVSSLCYAPTDHSTSSGGSRSEPHRPSDVQTDDWHSVHRDMCRFGILGIVSINTCSMCFEIQAGPWNGRIGGWGDYNCASNEPQPKCIVEHDEDDGWLQRRLDRNNCEITH